MICNILGFSQNVSVSAYVSVSVSVYSLSPSFTISGDPSKVSAQSENLSPHYRGTHGPRSQPPANSDRLLVVEVLHRLVDRRRRLAELPPERPLRLGGLS